MTRAFVPWSPKSRTTHTHTWTARVRYTVRSALNFGCVVPLAARRVLKTSEQPVVDRPRRCDRSSSLGSGFWSGVGRTATSGVGTSKIAGWPWLAAVASSPGLPFQISPVYRLFRKLLLHVARGSCVECAATEAREHRPCAREPCVSGSTHRLETRQQYTSVFSQQHALGSGLRQQPWTPSWASRPL